MKVTSSHYDFLFLSPHLDDVALSCGSYVATLAEAGAAVVVATVASGEEGTDNLSPLAQKAHELWGLSADAIARRREEDARACLTLGVDYVHLSVSDCVYRRSPATAAPFYSSQEDIFGPIHPEDEALTLPLLIRQLRGLPNAKRVFVPLAIGGHVDHALTRRAAEKALVCPLTYFEDFPYCMDLVAEPAVAGEARWRLHPEVVATCENSLRRKVAAVGEYRSQLSPVFGLHSAEERIRAHSARCGGERYWHPRPGCCP